VRLWLIIVLTLLAVAAAGLGLLTEISSSTPYSPFNVGGNGYSSLASLLNASVLTGPGSVSDTILLPLAHELGPEEYDWLKDFVMKGGTLVILDESGYSNVFLSDYLNIPADIRDSKLYDYVTGLGENGSIVAANVSIGGRELVCYFFKPSLIDVFGHVDVLGQTSPFVYADFDNNGFFSVGDRFDEWSVVVHATVANGSVFILSDLDVFSNSFISLGNNSALAKALARGTVGIYLGGLNASFLDYFKAYTVYSRSFSGTLAELLSLSLIAVVIGFGRRWAVFA